MDAPVRIWDELVELQTYGVGAPDANPMFLEQRVYQGSSGAMYPLALIDKVLDEPRPEPHRAVFLENRYLKVMVLPGLGGRVHMALDKTNGYAFVYHNHVIKPALVGLAGPWISGGIEFNWPQHHRPSTYEPLEWTVETHGDGSMTVWCGEIERMSRMKGAAGFTLHPDKAVLEVRVRMQNRMPYAQSFLWWANPAVHANDDYQSVFPPDVHGVFDHGRRDVSEFPIARGTYYKVDYSAGVDISRWRNIPVPTSYMAAHSDCDFLGGYDHGRRAGMLHVADHHLSPGKKQWVWGNGEFGLAWDRQLTDADGPYLELMAGVYTDNQPDFTWIQPFESKTFSQYFLPYKEIGYVRNASADFLLSLALDAGQARVGVYATGLEPGTGIRLTAGGEPLAQWTVDLDPERPFLETVELPAGTREEDLRLAVLRADGVEALGYQPAGPGAAPALEPACPVQPPADLPSCEQLYLTAQHLEQYRHATVEPMPYYQEALRREPGDSRCSTALGLLLLKRGRFREAEGHFRAAVATLTRHNANPAQGEAHFHLGHALLLQGRDREACDALSKAAWCAPVKDAAHTLLAQLDARRGQLDGALRHLDLALERNSLNYLARGLRAAVLRRLGRDAAARDGPGAWCATSPWTTPPASSWPCWTGPRTAGRPWSAWPAAMRRPSWRWRCPTPPAASTPRPCACWGWRRMPRGGSRAPRPSWCRTTGPGSCTGRGLRRPRPAWPRPAPRTWTAASRTAWRISSCWTGPWPRTAPTRAPATPWATGCMPAGSTRGRCRPGKGPAAPGPDSPPSGATSGWPPTTGAGTGPRPSAATGRRCGWTPATPASCSSWTSWRS